MCQIAIFQISLVVLIVNCTPSRVITYTNIVFPVRIIDSEIPVYSRNENTELKQENLKVQAWK